MDNSLNSLDKMTSHQLLDLRNTLERARDDKVAELKQVEAELKAIIERLKRVHSAYYETLQKFEKSTFVFLMGIFNGSGIDCFNLNQRADLRETFFNMRYRKFLK